MSTDTRSRRKVWFPIAPTRFAVGDYVRVLYYPRRRFFIVRDRSDARTAEGFITSRTRTHLTIDGHRARIRVCDVESSSRRMRDRADAERVLAEAQRSMSRSPEGIVTWMRSDVIAGRVALLDSLD